MEVQKLILHFRRKEMNPLDYIYRALGCQLRPLEPTSREASLILQYMHSSPANAPNHRVENIYEVVQTKKRPGKKGGKKAASTNRKLLWHGTKAANLLSILSSGLTTNSVFAPVTGRSLGDGIYFADAFDKSCNYTSDHRYFAFCIYPQKQKK